MTSSMDNARALTKDDIKALRTANDAVSFHTNTDGSKIVATKRIVDGPWQNRASHEIPVGVSWTAYNPDNVGTTSYKHTFTSAFEMIHSPAHDRVWHTVVSCLKVGDKLRLHWVADNNNELVMDASLHHDELQLEVMRGESYDAVLTFNLESQVSLDNSARMVRH